MTAKEILDYLKPKYDIVDELGNDYKKVKFKDCKLLLDYITNLQQENEKLKYNARGQVNDYFKDKYADEVLKNTELKKENETLKAKLEIGKTCGFCPYYDYKSRCKKANELLQRHNEDTGDIYYKYNNRFVKSELKERLSEVLNGGDDK